MLSRKLRKLNHFISDHRGDTLIEVLICISIISFILAGGYVVARNSSTNVRSSQERSSAIQVSQAQLDSLRSLVSKGEQPPSSPFCINNDAYVTISGSSGCYFDANGNYSAGNNVGQLDYQISMTTQAVSNTSPPLTQVNMSLTWAPINGTSNNSLQLSYRLPVAGGELSQLSQPSCGTSGNYAQTSQGCEPTCSYYYQITYGSGQGAPSGNQNQQGTGCEGCVAPYQVPDGGLSPGNPCYIPCNLGATSPTTFNFTGSSQTFIVPGNVSVMTITATAGSGGPENSVPAGSGGEVIATAPVQACQTLTINVGGQGQSSTCPAGDSCIFGADGGAGGWPDGGAGATATNNGEYFSTTEPAGGGGGSSSVSLNGSLLVMAGAGGGDSINAQIGTNCGGGYGAQCQTNPGLGGNGGNPGQSGNPGYPWESCSTSCFGEGGLAGGVGCGSSQEQGGDGYNGDGAGGGGGGGHNGGTGGLALQPNPYVSTGSSGGGGGGCNYAEPGANNVSSQTGVNTGNGKVILSW